MTEDQKRRDSLGSWKAGGGTDLGTGKRGFRSTRRVGSCSMLDCWARGGR